MVKGRVQTWGQRCRKRRFLLDEQPRLWDSNHRVVLVLNPYRGPGHANDQGRFHFRLSGRTNLLPAELRVIAHQQ
jgi:hypothetical protein